MKYIQDCDISIEDRVKKACELTDTPFSQEIVNEYQKRINKLNLFVQVFGMLPNESVPIPETRVLRKHPMLLTDRSIQRSLYGMAFFRAFMQFEAVDYTKGKRKQTEKNSDSQLLKIYYKLVEKYGFENVHPERPYLIGKNKRCDFYIVPEDKYIEVFHTKYPIYNILAYKRKNLKEFKDTHNLYYIHNNNEPVALFENVL